MIYDEIEMAPLEVLFNKLHGSRGGEMMLIHVTEDIGDDANFKCFSAIDKDNSILLDLIPQVLEQIHKRRDEE